MRGRHRRLPRRRRRRLPAVRRFGSFRQRCERPLTGNVAAVLAADFQGVDIRAPFRFQAQGHLKPCIL
jgi:hypothetical protein